MNWGLGSVQKGGRVSVGNTLQEEIALWGALCFVPLFPPDKAERLWETAGCAGSVGSRDELRGSAVQGMTAWHSSGRGLCPLP